jgi:hypothetical protein
VSFQIAVTVAFAERYLLFWVGVTFILNAVGATALLGASGADAILELAPAALISIFVLSLGSVIGVAQLAVNSYGTRAPLVLVRDWSLSALILRPMLLALCVLALASQAPASSGDTPSWLEAAHLSVALATGTLIVHAATSLFRMLFDYSDPRKFRRKILEGVGRDFSKGWLGNVEYKVPLLGQMVMAGLRRGDSPTVREGLAGLLGIERSYAAAAQEGKPVRTYERGTRGVADHWLGVDLAREFRRLSEEATRRDARGEAQMITQTLNDIHELAIEAGHIEEAEYLAAAHSNGG